MKEREFQTQFGRSLLRAGWWYYKIPDVLGDRYTADKPCDCIAVSPSGVVCFFELKVADIKFYYRDIRESQYLNLNALHAKKQQCFVVVYWKNTDTAFVIPWGNIVNSVNHGVKGIASRGLDAEIHPVLRPVKMDQTMGKRGKLVGGKAAWDLTELMDYIGIRKQR